MRERCEQYEKELDDVAQALGSILGRPVNVPDIHKALMELGDTLRKFRSVKF